jgi:hypothetical protein
MAAELVTTYYTNHAEETAEGAAEWREFATADGRKYQVNLRTGAQAWLEAPPTNPQLAHLHQLFEKHDVDNKGELGWDEFWQVLNELGLGMSDDEIGGWHAFADSDANGVIHWSEVCGKYGMVFFCRR